MAAAAAPDGCDEERLAAQYDTPVLITAPTARHVSALALRIRQRSCRAAGPLVQVPAAALPANPATLSHTCALLLRSVKGGSLLVVDVEEMPPAVQSVLMELLGPLPTARTPLTGVRVIAGTTVSLVDRVSAGAFAARLFYRLNVIHVIARRCADV